MAQKSTSILAACVLVTMAVGARVAGAARDRRVVKLTVGQSQTLSVEGAITKVQVLNPDIADVASYTHNTVTVVGVDGGSTELLVTTARRTFKFVIAVTRVEVGRLYKQIREFLGRNVEGIYPRLVGDTVVLSGWALTPDDYGRAQRAAQLFGDKVLNLVRFRPSAVQQINQILQRSGLTDVTARLIGATLFLEGAVGSDAELKKVQAILRAYGLNAENLVRVGGGGKQVLVDVQLVEMRKSDTDRIGVEWPGRIGIGSSEGDLGSVRVSVPIRPSGPAEVALDMLAPIAPASVALNMLFSSGKARLLAQPKLVCASGQSAEFLVGGEVPLPLITINAANVQFKEFGIKLAVTPTADSLGNISMAITAEVSGVDAALAVNNIPGFRTRRFKTFVTVKEGSAIVLSGLFTSDQQKSVAKWPLLGHLPILGELFKSREFRDEKTTLVVFVTPKAVSPKHPWVINTLRDIQRLYGEYEAEVGWQLFD